jgi:tetratricopeptide (TPR) repeat protein
MKLLTSQRPRIEAMLGGHYFRKATSASSSQSRQEFAQEAVRRLENTKVSAQPTVQRKITLHRLAMANEMLEDDKQAAAYARQVISLFPEIPPIPDSDGFSQEELLETWDTFRSAHLLLGRVAFRARDLAQATQHLQCAGRSPTTPAQESFGPDLRLARDLASQGHFPEVIEYLEELAKRWRGGRAKTNGWIQALQQGAIPEGREWL